MSLLPDVVGSQLNQFCNLFRIGQIRHELDGRFLSIRISGCIVISVGSETILEHRSDEFAQFGSVEWNARLQLVGVLIL